MLVLDSGRVAACGTFAEVRRQLPDSPVLATRSSTHRGGGRGGDSDGDGGSDQGNDADTGATPSHPHSHPQTRCVRSGGGHTRVRSGDSDEGGAAACAGDAASTGGDGATQAGVVDEAKFRLEEVGAAVGNSGSSSGAARDAGQSVRLKDVTAYSRAFGSAAVVVVVVMFLANKVRSVCACVCALVMVVDLVVLVVVVGVQVNRRRFPRALLRVTSPVAGSATRR